MKITGTAVRLGVVALVLLLFTVIIIVVFGQIRFDRTTGYSAIFTNASGLRNGQFVRASGVEVGKVSNVALIDGGKRVRVEFSVDRSVPLYQGTTASIRCGPGSAKAPRRASANSSTVLTRADIEARQVSSVQELLADLAGINIDSSGGLGQQSSVFIRGADSDHTLLLIDGVRVGSATLGRSPLLAARNLWRLRLSSSKNPAKRVSHCRRWLIVRT